MIPRARPGRPVAGSARPTQQQAQLTGKFGARGLKDPFEMEADLKGITPPPRIMDQYMREWKTRQASMNPEVYRANGRRSKAEQMAYLGAMMKEQYQQDKQNEVNILSDKFAKDFMCWLKGDDPTSPGDPAYVRDRMQLAGYNIKQPTRMRGEGVDEYLTSFLDKKSEFVKKWTRIRMGPHRAFKWNLGHFYLFYKYFLRNAPYTEDELLSDFDCFYPDLSSPRNAQPYRELGHKDVIFYDGQRPKLEPHSAFCGTEAPTNQQPPVTVKNQPSVPEPPGPPSNIQQAQKQEPGAPDQIKPEPGQPSSQPQPQPPPQGPNTQVVAGPLPQYPVNAPQAAGVPVAPTDTEDVPVSTAPVSQPVQPNLQSGQAQPVVDPKLAAEFQQAAQAQFQELANRLEIAQQEVDEHNLRRQTGEGFSLIAYGRALQQVTRLKDEMEGVQSTYTGQTSTSSPQNPPALPTPPTADVPRIEKSHGAVDLKEDRMVPVQGSGSVAAAQPPASKDVVPYKGKTAMVTRSASKPNALQGIKKMNKGKTVAGTLQLAKDVEAWQKGLVRSATRPAGARPEPRQITDGSETRAMVVSGPSPSSSSKQPPQITDGSESKAMVVSKPSSGTTPARKAITGPRGPESSGGALVRRQSLRLQNQVAAKADVVAAARMSGKMEAEPTPTTVYPPLTEVEMQNAPPLPISGQKRKAIEAAPRPPSTALIKASDPKDAAYNDKLAVALVIKTAEEYAPYFVGKADHDDVRDAVRAAAYGANVINELSDAQIGNVRYMSNEQLAWLERAFGRAWAYVKAVKNNKSTQHLVAGGIDANVDKALRRVGTERARRAGAITQAGYTEAGPKRLKKS